MDSETKYYIQDEVNRQLSYAVDEMRKALAKKALAERRQVWWRRLYAWAAGQIGGRILAYRLRRWESLSEEERRASEDLWLGRTLKRLSGKWRTERNVETGPEAREEVLETDFVKSILEQPSKDVN